MASSKEYLEFILGQLSELEEITYRAMMGEFIIPPARCCAAMATVTTAIRTRWTFPPENRALPLQSR